MIFPSGNSRNAQSNPLVGESEASRDPRSPHYQPEMKKDVRNRASRANRESFADIAAELAGKKKAEPAAYAAVRSAHSIGKANLGAVSDIGGGVKYLGSSTQNSIWNPTRIADIKAEELTQGERIKAENKRLEETRQQHRREQFTIDPEALKAAMQSGSSINGSRATPEVAPSYKNRVAAHQMSIFDKADKFDNIASPTNEVAIRAGAKARREKSDRSWEQPTAPVTAKSKLSALFQNLKNSVEGK